MQSIRQRREIVERVRSASSKQDQESCPSSDSIVPASVPLEEQLEEAETKWDDYDQDLDPRNWPIAKKMAATLLVTAIAFVTQYASAVTSGAAEKIQAHFHTGLLTETWATGIFLWGLAIGSPFAGPLSEIGGRNPVYLSTFSLFVLCTLAAALAVNVHMQLAFRFLMGLFGSTPLVCAGGTVSDLWTPRDQIRVFPLYATGAFMGLAIGPLVGGQIGQESNDVSWRWVEWTNLIMSGTLLLVIVLCQPETHGKTLLRWKHTAQISVIHHKEGKTAQVQAALAKSSRFARLKTFGAKLVHAFIHPITVSITEPILLMLSLYLSVCYVVIFSFLPGYTFIFTDVYAFGPARRGLVYLGLGVGFLLTLLLSWPVSTLSYRIIKRNGSLQPEVRLFYAICGAPFIPISLFWMAWTSRSSISPWSAITATVPLAFGVLCVFLSCNQYIIDVYAQYASSGLVFVSLLRYLLAGAMIEVAIPMYENLGIAITLTILGSIGAILTPIPFLLYTHGPAIRARSKMSR